MTHSTQAPEVPHLYPAAAQPFNRGNADYAPVFNDYGTRVPPRSKKKRIVYLQPHESTTSKSRLRSYNFVQFIGQPDLIDHLEELIRAAHGMAPNYADDEDIGLLNAHPPWVTDQNHSELEDNDERSISSPIDSRPDSTSLCQTPRECQTRSSNYLKKPSMDQYHASAKQYAEPNLLRTRCDLPGPGSQDDDEDSSPIVQELDRAEHTRCSSNYYPTLTLSLGASALGSEKSPLATPTSPSQNAHLTDSTEKVEGENAKLTFTFIFAICGRELTKFKYK